MRKTTSLLLTLLLASTALQLVAQTDPAPAAGDRPSVEELVAMEPKARRAALKSMDPKERRGLWYEVKKAQHKLAEKSAGPYTEGYPIDVGGWPADGPAGIEVVGTIVYDSGFPNRAFGGGQLVGNRFDTHTGIPVLASGTVSTVQALVVQGQVITTSSAGFVMHGPQSPATPSGDAMAIFSTFTSAIGVIDSLVFSGLGVNYTGSEFFVLFGDFASSYIPVFGTESTMGQGRHALVGYTGGTFPNFTRTFAFGGIYNGFIRATGNIVPVELMSFEID